MRPLEKLHRIPLKIKICQILKKCGYPKCENFLEKLSVFNYKIVNKKKSIPYIKQKIKESNHFYNGKPNNERKYYMDINPFTINYEIIQEEFLKNLTKEEFRKIQQDKEFYLKERDLINKLTIFEHDSLFQILSKEEKGIKTGKINLKQKLNQLKINAQINDDDDNEKENEKNAERLIRKGIQTERIKKYKEYIKHLSREKKLQKIHSDLLNEYQNIEKIEGKSRNKYHELLQKNSFLITQQKSKNDNILNKSKNKNIYRTMDDKSPKRRKKTIIKNNKYTIDNKRKTKYKNNKYEDYVSDISSKIRISYLSKKDDNENIENENKKIVHFPSLSLNLEQKNKI